MDGQTEISLGGIAERAEKLEVATKAAAETPAAENKSESSASSAEKAPIANAPGAAPIAKAPTEEKKLPNDPDELRKWNTRVSMENKAVKDELAAVKKQLESLSETLSKSTKKQVDWKDLAKDPVKLQAAIEAQQKEAVEEVTGKHRKYEQETAARITKLENQRRMHDPAYPRWAEMQQALVDMAVKGDTRIDFSKDPADVLDQMYDLALKAHPVAADAAPAAKTFTEAEVATQVEKAKAEAIAEAQKGLIAEGKGAGVAGMGKGATKGPGGVDKEALKNMPLHELKRMIQSASDK